MNYKRNFTQTSILRAIDATYALSGLLKSLGVKHYHITGRVACFLVRMNKDSVVL